LLMLGRETTLPVDLLYGLPPTVPMDLCPVEYVEWVKEATQESFQFARDNLQRAATRQKRNYDKRATERKFEKRDWVLRLYPPNLTRDKLNARYVGPYLMLERTGEVNYKIQSGPRANPVVVHVDHLKPYHTEEPLESWVGDGDSNASPNEKGCQTDPLDDGSDDAEQVMSPRWGPEEDKPEPGLRRGGRTRKPPAWTGWTSSM